MKKTILTMVKIFGSLMCLFGAMRLTGEALMYSNNSSDVAVLMATAAGNPCGSQQDNGKNILLNLNK